MLVDERLQLIGWQYARLSPHYFSIFENHECGYAEDVIDLGCCGVFVDIDFNDVGLIAHFCFELFEDGLHHFTWATPFGEKIDEYRLVGLDEFLEVCHVGRV